MIMVSDQNENARNGTPSSQAQSHTHVARLPALGHFAESQLEPLLGSESHGVTDLHRRHQYQLRGLYKKTKSAPMGRGLRKPPLCPRDWAGYRATRIFRIE